MILWTPNDFLQTLIWKKWREKKEWERKREPAWQCNRRLAFAVSTRNALEGTGSETTFVVRMYVCTLPAMAWYAFIYICEQFVFVSGAVGHGRPEITLGLHFRSFLFFCGQRFRIFVFTVARRGLKSLRSRRVERDMAWATNKNWKQLIRG